MRQISKGMLAAAAGLASLLGHGALAATACEQLASSTLPQGVAVTSAETMPAGTFQPPTGPALDQLPDFCRVAGRIENHPTSRIMFEVWLPTRTSNHRFVQVGNGG